jgi:putative PEP-CTERM system histidine kinase
MNTIAVVSYAAACGLFLLLGLLLVTSWRGRMQGGLLVTACFVSAGWAGLIAVSAMGTGIPLKVIAVAEFVRDGAWLVFLARLAQTLGVSGLTRTLAHVAWGGALIWALSLWFGVATEPGVVMIIGGLGVALMGLVLVEQVYLNAPSEARWGLKFLVISVGGMLAYDLFLFSQAYISKSLAGDAWSARGLVNAAIVPCLAIAARRNPTWSLKLFVSRHVVFYSTALTAIGLYMIFMAAGGYWIHAHGGSWGGVAQIAFIVGALGVLVAIIGSGKLRSKARVFVGKHFYENKFDYREEWLQLIGTLAKHGGQEDVRPVAIRSLARIVGSPGGTLWLFDEDEQVFQCRSELNAVREDARLTRDHSLIRFMEDRQWIIQMAEWRDEPTRYGDLHMPSWLADRQDRALVVPLLLGSRLSGFIVLLKGAHTKNLDYEDRDLLKTVGRQLATHLARHDADMRLSESRQFDAYNRLTAFIMHDIKNLVAQLSLVVSNADRHRDNPEFVSDMVDTVNNSVARMNRLMNQLLMGETQGPQGRVPLTAAVEKALTRCEGRTPEAVLLADPAGLAVQADAGRLVQVLEHVIRNAQDACANGGAVTISFDRSEDYGCIRVEDTGCGMEAEFLEDRLFRPFDSTKGTKGMGIGAYQVREYVRMMDGRVKVVSAPGEGTTFDILLPLDAERPVGAPSDEADRAIPTPLGDRPGTVTEARVSMGTE